MWVTAFLDFPAHAYDAGVSFWAAATGSTVSSPRGDHGEFGTLLPPDGDPYLRVQRLGAGPTRVHLDLHDPTLKDRAIAHGARLIAEDGYATLASPSGLVFCVVSESLSRRPMIGDLVLDQVCIDVAEHAFGDEFEFWERLLDRDGDDDGGQFAHLPRTPDEPLRVMLQRCGPGTTKAHLDFAATDRHASVRWLVGLGATEVRRTTDWTTLRDPAGLEFCVTDREPGTGRLPAESATPL
jgi:hypothetical protein